jgi:saccharopine dehydrogenase-like NADP-dependent oxidoreductase
MMSSSTDSASVPKKILILGAGRSSTYLIDYLAKKALDSGWLITVGDMELEPARKKTEVYPHVQAILFDVFDQKQREKQISQADVVISMLPTVYHIHVARACMRFNKHLLTASYVSSEIRELNIEATHKNLLILMEMGLDPGIDHMSAMRVINRIKNQGGKVVSYKSYCGGLMDTQADENPWNYKFTWNPRNVVVAGQGMVKYIAGGQYKYIPAHQVFARAEQIDVQDFGPLEAYGNRDSLSYREAYGLADVKTMLRGTLRPVGFCPSWQVLVRLGLTDSVHRIENTENMTYRDWVRTFLGESDLPIEKQIANYLGLDEHSEEMKRLEWLDILSDEKITLPNATPAEILQFVLERKWKLKPEEKDIIVMQHEFEYELNGETKHLVTSLIVRGEDNIHTAMAKTVGLPIAVAAKLLLEGQIKERGVQIPVHPDIYEPVLDELENLGITFREYEVARQPA